MICLQLSFPFDSIENNWKDVAMYIVSWKTLIETIYENIYAAKKHKPFELAFFNSFLKFFMKKKSILYNVFS